MRTIDIFFLILHLWEKREKALPYLRDNCVRSVFLGALQSSFPPHNKIRYFANFEGTALRGVK